MPRYGIDDAKVLIERIANERAESAVRMIRDAAKDAIDRIESEAKVEEIVALHVIPKMAALAARTFEQGFPEPQRVADVEITLTPSGARWGMALYATDSYPSRPGPVQPNKRYRAVFMLVPVEE